MTKPAAAIGPGAFAVRLRRLREAAALTQEELAERAGLTVKAVGALERGERRKPYPHTVRALAEALQLDESARTAFVEAVRHSGEDRPTKLLHQPGRLEQDHNNLRVALGTLRERGDPGRMARLGADTWLYWVLRGHAGEARAWLEDLVGGSSTNGMTAVDRAAAYLGLAGLRYAAGDIPGTRAAATDAVEVAQADQHQVRQAEALLLQGASAVFQNDLDAAVAPLAEAASRAEAAGDAFTLAQARFAQGQLEFQAGNLDRSTVILAESEAIARRARLPFTLGVVLNMQAMVAELTGADDVALDQLEEAAELAAEVGTTWTLVYTLPALGILAARRGLFQLAAVLFAAGAATAEASSVTVSFPPSREGADHWLATVRRELDPAEWDRAEDAGRALAPVSLPGLAATIRRHGPS